MSITTGQVVKLEATFLINLPAQEYIYIERVLYHLQDAYWYFIDFMETSTKKSMSWEQFLFEMMHNIWWLRESCKEYTVTQLRDVFSTYIGTIPVYGCIIHANRENTYLLVQGPTGRWSFPKGKQNERELPLDVAIRETREETGLELQEKLFTNARVVYRKIGNRLLGMFHVTLKKELPVFINQHCKTEITNIKWFQKRDIYNRHRFPTIYPFLNQLKDTG
jgi:mRNA-decapping enzyme subunit 2